MVACGEDFKLTTGTEYKDATVSRVEPDGLVVSTSDGITKLKFAELTTDVQKRYGYDPSKAERFAQALNASQSANAAKIAQTEAQVAAAKTQVAALADAEKMLKKLEPMRISDRCKSLMSMLRFSKGPWPEGTAPTASSPIRS